MFKAYLEQVVLEGFISDKIDRLAQGSDKDPKELLDKFNKYRNQHSLDINKFNTLDELVSTLDSIESGETQTKSQIKAEAKEESIKLIDNESFLVIIPLSREASCTYGKGTKWCISASSGNYWKNYSNSIFVMVEDHSLEQNNPEYKVALRFDEEGNFFDAWDATDKKLSLVPVHIKEIFPQIKNYIAQNLDVLKAKIKENLPIRDKVDDAIDDFHIILDHVNVNSSISVNYSLQKDEWTEVKEELELESFEELGQYVVDNGLYENGFAGLEGLAILSGNETLLEHSDYATVGTSDFLIRSVFYGGVRLNNWLKYSKPFMTDFSLVNEINSEYDMEGLYNYNYEIDLSPLLEIEFNKNNIHIGAKEHLTKNQTLATFNMFEPYFDAFASVYNMNMQGKINYEDFNISTTEDFKNIIPKVKEMNQLNFTLSFELKS